MRGGRGIASPRKKTPNGRGRLGDPNMVPPLFQKDPTITNAERVGGAVFIKEEGYFN